MEKKFLELVKMANELNEKQKKVYAEINYTANDNKKLEICIRSKKNFKYVEMVELQLNNSLINWDTVINLFREYIGGVANE